MIISYYVGYRLHRPCIGKISTWMVIVPRHSLLTYRNWLMWLDKDSVSASKSSCELVPEKLPRRKSYSD